MTNLQWFYERSRKIGFPKIMKVSTLKGQMRKDFNSDQDYWKRNGISISENDLVIVRVTTWYSDSRPGNYSFEKIVGDPVSYLLKKLYEQEERSEDLRDALPSDD